MNRDELAGARILVVEDELMIAMLLEDMLDELGCALVAAVGNVEAALDRIAADRIDAAILDVNLAGGKGDRVAEALIARGVPFLIATGAHPDSLTWEGYRGRQILRKPFQLEGLASGLARTLRPDS